ncbi:MAG TPA: type I-U CRISPR-associated RAMP protein Csb1/Cas7u [Tepidisphaeraceae bacterium]|jgi:CRISPR-associated protein Csb1|nr:type I-U CRISPR-associated RAMP protein Csb1/Cas7u [Tepidisphaeraceae bacterium]
MSDVDLSALLDPKVTRLLMTIPLKPLQGDRFQPTGFPSLGAATYQTKHGTKLIVESPQSMANRLEKTCWDDATNEPIAPLAGISHVTVRRGKEEKVLAKKAFLTNSMLEAHRINSPYLLEGSDKSFRNDITSELGVLADGPIDRGLLAKVLLKYDIGSLIHGVFLAKPYLAGGRLRVARALSAVIEASDANVAPYGGVKNDHVNPSGDTGKGFGNVPFARDDFVANQIDLFINLDLAQIRGYGLDDNVQKLLILLSLYKVRKLIDGDLRLRTACDLEPIDRKTVKAMRPAGFILPDLTDLETALSSSIKECKDKDGKSLMTQKIVAFDDELKKRKDKPEADGEKDDETNGENETPNDE